MTTTNPVALAVEIKALLEQLMNLVRALLVQIEVPQPAGAKSGLKRADDRLTAAGIDALYADFAENKLNTKQIMLKHDISRSGFTKRKAKWRKGVR